MTVKDTEQTSRYGPGLPNELLNATWLVEEGVETSTNRHWEFEENGVYQIGQGALSKALLVYLRDEGIHHVFKSYRVAWLTAYTDQQLHGMEVLKMEKDMKPCPHCGGKVLKAEVIKDKTGADGQFVGQVSCMDKCCRAVTRWRIVLPKDSAKSDGESLTLEEKSARLEAAAREILIATWNRRA